MSILFIAPDNAKDIIVLEHPRTAIPSQFLLTDDHAIFEIISLTLPHKQSLLGTDFIVSDAPVHVATPFDPAFFLISALQGSPATERFVESDELLDVFPRRVRKYLEKSLPDVCDCLGTSVNAGDTYWRFSLPRVLSYLQSKIARTQDSLPKSIMDGLPGDETLLPIAKQRAALELITSYLPQSLAEDLIKLYDFSALNIYQAAQKSDFVNPNEFIKRKNEDNEVEITATKKQKKGSKGVEALKKVNTRGMKSMTSFFTKKAKA